MTANSKYINRVLEVTGKVKEVNSDWEGKFSVVIDAGNPTYAVICHLAKSEITHAKKIQKDDEISLHGTCKGMTTDVIMEDCTIDKKTDFVF